MSLSATDIGTSMALARNGQKERDSFVTILREGERTEKTGKELTPPEIPGIQLLFFRIYK